MYCWMKALSSILILAIKPKTICSIRQMTFEGDKFFKLLLYPWTTCSTWAYEPKILDANAPNRTYTIIGLSEFFCFIHYLWLIYGVTLHFLCSIDSRSHTAKQQSDISDRLNRFYSWKKVSEPRLQEAILDRVLNGRRRIFFFLVLGQVGSFDGSQSRL